MPPRIRLPKTINTPMPGPTASFNSGFVMSITESPATKRVIRPRASVTTSLVLFGKRSPKSVPIRAPATIARKLIIVPKPIII